MEHFEQRRDIRALEFPGGGHGQRVTRRLDRFLAMFARSEFLEVLRQRRNLARVGGVLQDLERPGNAFSAPDLDQRVEHGRSRRGVTQAVTQPEIEVHVLLEKFEDRARSPGPLGNELLKILFPFGDLFRSLRDARLVQSAKRPHQLTGVRRRLWERRDIPGLPGRRGRLYARRFGSPGIGVRRERRFLHRAARKGCGLLRILRLTSVPSASTRTPFPMWWVRFRRSHLGRCSGTATTATTSATLTERSPIRSAVSSPSN